VGTRTFTGLYGTKKSTSPPIAFHYSEFSVEVDVGVQPEPGPPQYFVRGNSDLVVKKPTAVTFAPDGKVYSCNVKGTLFSFFASFEFQ
jgi:hypothetical protein